MKLLCIDTECDLFIYLFYILYYFQDYLQAKKMETNKQDRICIFIFIHGQDRAGSTVYPGNTGHKA